MREANDVKSLLRDIRRAMDYAVPEAQRAGADDLVDQYRFKLLLVKNSLKLL